MTARRPYAAGGRARGDRPRADEAGDVGGSGAVCEAHRAALPCCSASGTRLGDRGEIGGKCDIDDMTSPSENPLEMGKRCLLDRSRVPIRSVSGLVAPP